MIDTFHARLPDPASQLGDTLIEVVISALILALVVVGTLTGLNSANRVTSLGRERSQADTLAQQEEDQLRSEPIKKLSELSQTHEVIQHEVNASGTKYTVTSTAQYIADATATTSCSATTAEADYIQTTSNVTWNSLGTGKPVVETSVISPPPGSVLIAQVTNQATEALPNASVTATGKSSYSDETSKNGCAILAVEPGQYTLNVSKAGYVDENGYPNSDEDPLTSAPVYVVAENSVKKPFKFGKAGALEMHFANASTNVTETGDAFTAANTSMNPAIRAFGATGTYTSSVTTAKTLFPFPEGYTVFAGSCEADNPANFGISPAKATLGPGETVSATVPQPPVKIRVMSGTEAGSSHEGTAVASATVVVTDTGCSTTRTLTTESKGALSHPGLPYGKYSMCVGTAGKTWEGIFENKTTSGPPETWTGDGTKENSALIYMGTSPSGSPGKTKTGTCP
jgi:Tfp pilus assembly protein PilV